MARLIRVKNTNATDSWEGQVIAPGEYYTLEESEYERWAKSSKVYGSVSNGTLIVNNGADNIDDFVNPISGWKWLAGDTTPPQSADGDWHIVNENFAHISGNKGINWVIEKDMENEEGYSEILVLPAGRHATLNMMRGGSDQVPSTVKLEWFVELEVDVFMRYNPWIRADEVIAARVNGAHTSGDTVITLQNTDNEIAKIRKYHYHQFYDAATSNTFFAKIIDKDLGANTITLSSGIPIDLAHNSSLALTDRAIGRIGNQIASDSLVWVSPPNEFYGNGKNYFKLTVTNEDNMRVGLITANLNGWHTDTNGGD